VTQNMELALRKTYEAVPSPKLVIAVGASAPYRAGLMRSSEQRNGADGIMRWTYTFRLSAASHHDFGRIAETVGRIE